MALLLHPRQRDAQPRTASPRIWPATTVDDVVSRLRRHPARGRARGAIGDGYRLRVPEGALDLQRFEALACQAGRG